MVRVVCYSYAVINRLKMYIFTYTYASILLLPIFNVVNTGLYLLGVRGLTPPPSMKWLTPLLSSKTGSIDCLLWICATMFLFVRKGRCLLTTVWGCVVGRKWLVRFCKKPLFGFGFTELTVVSFFSVRFFALCFVQCVCCFHFKVYWIGPANCHSKWL